MKNIDEKVINIVIAEDNILTRITLKKMLNITPYINVCADFDNAEACINFIECSNDVDLIIMDAILPNMSGIDASKIIKQINPDVKILMLTTDNDDRQVVNTLFAHADAYFIRDFSQELLQNTILHTMKGICEIDKRIQYSFFNLLKTMSDKDYLSFISRLTQDEFNFLLSFENDSYEELSLLMRTPMYCFRPYIYSILCKFKKFGLCNRELKYDLF